MISPILLDILATFNTRELATLMWGSVFLIWMSTKSDVRSSFWRLLKGFAGAWKVMVPMSLYIALSVCLLRYMQLWDVSSLKVTIFWFFGWALLMLLSIPKARQQEGYLEKIVGEIIGMSIAVSFIANFYTFPLVVELFLVPVVAIAAALAVFSKLKKARPVELLANGVLILVGSIATAFSLWEVFAHIREFVTCATFLEFLTPMLLSAMFLLYLYLLSKYMEYEEKKLRQRHHF